MTEKLRYSGSFEYKPGDIAYGCTLTIIDLPYMLEGLPKSS